MVEEFARVFELVISFIALGGAGALDDGLRASILRLLGLIPDNFIIRFGSIGGKASLTLSQILCRLQSEQVLPEPSSQRLVDQSCKGGEGLRLGPMSSPQQLDCPGREVPIPTSTRLEASHWRCDSPSGPPPVLTAPWRNGE
jgi:hypothetical protein